MKMLIIAAAAMAGGAVLGFALCWAATRLAGGNRKAAARLAKAAEKKMGTMDKVLTKACAAKVIAAALLIPTGIASMDMNISSQRLVESSNNFAMIRMENNEVVFHCQTRSAVASKKEALCRQIDVLASMIGATVEHSGDYPAWEYNPNSRLQPLFEQTYRDLFHKDARVEGIHAGLECGLFAEKFRKLGRNVDFLYFGPTVSGAHTTRECLSLSSAENTWKLLIEVLRRIGEKA